MTLWVSIVDSGERSLARQFESNLIVSDRHYSAFIVQDLDGDVSHIALVRSDKLSVSQQA